MTARDGLEVDDVTQNQSPDFECLLRAVLRGDRVALKLGQIATKWDKYGTFSFQYVLVRFTEQ